MRLLVGNERGPREYSYEGSRGSWRGAHRPGAGATLERRGEVADFGAERRAGVVGHAGLPDARDQQWPALHVAAAVSHGRADRVCAGDAGSPGWATGGTAANCRIANWP